MTTATGRPTLGVGLLVSLGGVLILRVLHEAPNPVGFVTGLTSRTERKLPGVARNGVDKALKERIVSVQKKLGS